MDKLKKAFKPLNRASSSHNKGEIGRIHMGSRFFRGGMIGAFATILLLSCAGTPPATVDGVDQMYDRYRDGNKKAMVNLIQIFEDPTVGKDARLQALKSIINSDDPNGLIAVRKALEEGRLKDHDLFMAAVQGLADTPGQKNVNTVVKALEKSRQYYVDERDIMLRIIENQADDRSVANLLALYTHSENDFKQFEATMTRVLGKLDDERVVPVLMAMAADKRVPLDVRNKAITLLGRKNDPAIGKLLAQLLQDPASQTQIRDFALAATDELKDGRVILALVEALHGEQAAYFTMVDAITRSLQRYNDPTIKPVLLAVATDDIFPVRIRKQALQGLSNYPEQEVAEALIVMLEQSENFVFYPEIKSIVDAVEMPLLIDRLQQTALAAQRKAAAE